MYTSAQKIEFSAFFRKNVHEWNAGAPAVFDEDCICGKPYAVSQNFAETSLL